jgi:hypothetical protein
MTLVLIGIVALISWFLGRIGTIYVQPQPIDRLKNALLSFALSMVCKKDISDDMYYGKYDGTKLPNLAGADVANACFSYILEIAEFRKDPWYTDVMEAKILAIHKYIDTNLNTDEKVAEFFDKYVNEIKSAYLASRTSCEKSS